MKYTTAATPKAPVDNAALIKSMLRVTAMLARMPVPQREIKMHPDDIEALKKACLENYPTAASLAGRDQFCGVALIPDDTADRHPSFYPSPIPETK